MYEEIKKLFEHEAIIGEPVYTLAARVAADPRGREPADEDAEDMYDPVAKIKERFKQSIYLCDERMLEFLRFAAELSARRAVWEDNYTDTPFYKFWRNAEKLHGDTKISGEKEMDEFLAEYIENDRLLKYIQSEVLWSCERLNNPGEVWEILDGTGIPLDDAAVVERFDRLYNNLRGNAHIWELRGFTPHQYLNHTGESVPYFRLPKI